MAQLTSQSLEHAAQLSMKLARVAELEQTQYSLQGIVSTTEGKVAECARYEVENQLM